jgi:iron complex outermembrane receptor protein
MKNCSAFLIGLILPFMTLSQVIQDKRTMKVIVVNEDNKLPVELATVAIWSLTAPQSVMGSGVTNQRGEFFLKIAPGNYLIKASCIGYEAHNGPAFEMKASRADTSIYSIALKKSGTTLGQVNITGTKKAIELIPGGYKFNIDQLIGATGNVYDVLRNVPGITVDGSNTIKLQGKGPTVMINGRKVNMTGNDLATYLKSVSATQVATIEVNLNPSAKFDADGEGGILDIKLKQTTIKGFSGNISSSLSSLVSNDNAANMKYKYGKWDLSANYAFTYREDVYRRKNDYQNLRLPDSLYNFKQEQVSNQYQKGNSIKSGIAYEIDSTSAISLNFFGAWFNSESPWDISSEVYNRTGLFQTKYLQNETNSISNHFFIYDLNYKKTFRNKSNLNLGFNYSNYSNTAEQQFNRLFYDINLNPVPNNYDDNRLINTFRPYRLSASNVDYAVNLSQQTKLEIGSKLTTAETKSVFNNFIFSPSVNGFIDDPILSNNLSYTETVFAGYGQLSGKINKLSYQLGLRYEGFHYKLTTPSLAEEFSKQYANLFPSLNLSYTSKDSKRTLSLNGTRRIQRPGYSLLNPFLNIRSLGQYSSGNPNLKPYFVNKVEIQFANSYGKGNFFMLAAYASQARNIYSAIFKYDPTLDMNIDTYDNLRNNNQFGGYVVLQNTIAKWFNLNAYVAGQVPTFSSKIPGDLLLPNLFYLTGNLSLNFTIAANTSFQVYGYCVTKNNSFQVQNGTNGNLSAAFQQKFFNKRLTAALNFEDIFNITQYPVEVYNQNVYLKSLNKLKTQYIKLGLSYAFGTTFNSKLNKDIKKDSRIE